MSNHASLIKNHLLAALPAKSYRQFQPHLTQVAMPFGEVLCKSGDPIRDLYFPNTSIVSIIATMQKRLTLEVGIVGNEGVVGIEAILGVNKARAQMIIQAEGEAMKISIASVLEIFNDDGATQRLLLRYVYAMTAQITQTAICNRFHRAPERLARWLVMTQDRIGRSEFRMTQEFLSLMLGIRREGVTLAALVLARRELISYSRGRIIIHDRRLLRAASCDCYRIVKKEHESVYRHDLK